MVFLYNLFLPDHQTHTYETAVKRYLVAIDKKYRHELTVSSICCSSWPLPFIYGKIQRNARNIIEAARDPVRDLMPETNGFFVLAVVLL